MIDLKVLLQNKISSIEELAQTLLQAFNLVNFKNVSSLLTFRKHRVGDVLSTGRTQWIVCTEPTPFEVNNSLYLKAIGDVFVEDFNDGKMSQSEYVSLANDFCMAQSTGNRLVFDADITYEFSHDTSFNIYVESGGWYCSGNCRLVWKGAPKAGYAIKVLGRFAYGHHYASLVNNSNYCPLEGFNIGNYNQMLSGIGLCIGSSVSLSSMNSAVVTSKFTIKRVSVFDFDDVIVFYPGVWACELHQVNTMGGSWQTPFYFNGLDFGESIKLTNCFIADNHRRVVDNELGKVNFNTGEFIVYGSSFNNMRVVVNGDAVVKMNCPHFENPQSKAKNKRFLEVVGSHAYCVLDKPQIVIRDTPIYSNLFYCKAGTTKNRHPYAGGLVFISPSYNAASNYRPDLAPFQDDDIEYESDGYLELVGGGGRVYLEGGAHINSLFYSNSPIPISRNLVGRSLINSDFSQLNQSNVLSGWRVLEDAGKVRIVNIGNNKTLRIDCDSEMFRTNGVYQEIDCRASSLLMLTMKYRWETEPHDAANSFISIEVEFRERDSSEVISSRRKLKGLSDHTDGKTMNWNMAHIYKIVPAGANNVLIRLLLNSNGTIGANNVAASIDSSIVNLI
ncbi:hypothetical protein GTH32_01970 [Alteromonas sp. 345S023]|uniref:Right-handed parallel beta-helix repeat-containing protein n=1 Tax=Alteromonas profundi TaxID=2696062 RepID=A0A7X5LIJ3_9ALTE|nr:hypothetical protein [Alteromonas profundi]NDV89963.1 hypothetical protein [Alteromonas profundi]